MSITPRVRHVSTPSITIDEFVLPPRFEVPAHAHAPPHVLVMLSGSLTERDGGTERIVEPRSIRYSPGGDMHVQITIGTEGAHCLVIGAKGFPELRLVQRMFVPAQAVVAEVDALDACLLADATASPSRVETHALALFSHVRARARAEHVLHHEWIARVRQHLDDHTASHAPSRTPLADAARSVARNPSVVARVFRATYGVSIQRHCRRLQVDEAWSLLGASTLSLGAIAAQCGFTDQSHLTRVIARESGFTPKQLRVRMSADSAARNWYRFAEMREVGHRFDHQRGDAVDRAIEPEIIHA